MSVYCIDARGLSCPQPVILTLNAMKNVESEHIEVLVDSEVCVENVTRAAHSQGWSVVCTEKERVSYAEWLLRLSKA